MAFEGGLRLPYGYRACLQLTMRKLAVVTVRSVIALTYFGSIHAENSALYEKQNTIRNLACEAGVPPEMALATMEHESGFRNEMRGRLGEIGVSQILPATAAALGLDQQRLGRDFAYNARAGVFIMRRLLRESMGDQRTALYNYKAGPNWKKLSPRTQVSLRTYAGAVEQLQRKYFGAGCR